jgi:Ulp1 family protease
MLSKKVFIPINENNHWFFIVINIGNTFIKGSKLSKIEIQL